MQATLRKLTRWMELRPGTSADAIRQVEEQLGICLPEDYVVFLKMSNGAEGFVGPDKTAYLQLWSIEDVPRLNAAYEVGHFAPGILVFGSNGGGTAYAFDLRRPRLPVLEVEFIPFALSEAHELASTFTGFLAFLARQSR